MTIVADSNLIIASVVKTHGFHARATAALAAPLQTGQLLIPQHVLFESFSVLTRGPAPLRARPEVAYRLLQLSYGSCRVIPTSVPDVWQFLRERDIRTAGGRLYDAVIAVAAIEAGAQRIMTFNPKHFETFADSIEIVVPA